MTSEATAMADEIIVGSANLEAIRIRIKAIQGGDVLRRINDHPAAKLHELLPWHWKQSEPQSAAA